MQETLLTNEASKIRIAQNAITIDDISYDEMTKRMNSSSSDWMPPYKERRKRWGFTISPSYSLWNPNKYISFITQDNNLQEPPQNSSFSSLYGTKTTEDGNTGYISFLAAVKYNLPTAAALSFGFGAGYYGNKGSNNLKLFMIPVVAEVTLTIDGIMNEPYFAPYVGIGLAYVYFKETYPTAIIDPPDPPNPDPNTPPNNTNTSPNDSDNSTSRTGNQFVFYYNAGVLLQLDWLERSADRAMQLIGIENTYIKVGIIHFFRNISALNNRLNESEVFTPRDLTSNIAFYAGLQLEF